MATATTENANATSGHSWRLPDNNQTTGIVAPGRRPVNGQVEIILGHRGRSAWDLGYVGCDYQAPLVSAYLESAGEEVELEHRGETQFACSSLVVSNGARSVYLESFRGDDVEAFARIVGEMLGHMVLAGKREINWWVEWGQGQCVLFAGWTREMVESLRDQADALADRARARRAA